MHRLRPPFSNGYISHQCRHSLHSRWKSSIPQPESQQNNDIRTLNINTLHLQSLPIPQPPVPPLQYGLSRVLFNPGMYQLQDPYTRVYNFDPYLQQIIPISDFNFSSLKEYKTSSKDGALSALARSQQKKYIGSTSSMTSSLSHFHYLLSNWRPINLNMLSRGFSGDQTMFTLINRAPAAIFLKHQGEGQYAIDADKEFDGATVLMMLGKALEKLLTLPKEEYERYRRDSDNPISETEAASPESYNYTTFGNFLMRSQLDAYDPRLPGTGMFDIKTRAVLTVRHDASNPEKMLGYEIQRLQGDYESVEREHYDMLRATTLKYLLQARMGRMDGIFVAYHNIERIFGFQYLNIYEMDRALHGQMQRCLGDGEFMASLGLYDDVLERATARFPHRHLRVHFEAVRAPTTMLWVFVEPVSEEEIEVIQGPSRRRQVLYERRVMGVEGEGDVVEEEEPGEETTDKKKPLMVMTLIVENKVNGAPCPDNRPENLQPTDEWTVDYILKEVTSISDEAKWELYEQCKKRRKTYTEKVPNSNEDGEVSGYIAVLRALAEKGRKYRQEMDELDRGKEKVVYV
ncbi:Pet127-domain-containing protein [Piedraia hortae CBS 480.64]|uniref:Pet127-domain-containing protein n=1 Tax=Piedraia hortae CBS 480.64 TaxID=1314780 RepID=A0A6A7C4J1_9PEZI|nr:Pet127-domain-containing protein [Piedraia hortae CBS 480.64]